MTPQEELDLGAYAVGFLNRSSLFLGPIQGLANAAMGAVFVTAK
jgi:hypothetical protein